MFWRRRVDEAETSAEPVAKPPPKTMNLYAADGRLQRAKALAFCIGLDKPGWMVTVDYSDAVLAFEDVLAKYENQDALAAARIAVPSTTGTPSLAPQMPADTSKSNAPVEA